MRTRDPMTTRSARVDGAIVALILIALLAWMVPTAQALFSDSAQRAADHRACLIDAATRADPLECER